MALLYSAYDLCFASELALPELHPGHGEADVQIRYASLDADGSACGTQIAPFVWAGKDCLWLRVPNIGRFHIREGKEILIDPESGCDEDSLRVFLLGSAFGALLFQRGHLVLHGNAVQVEGRAMICVGPSGAGKSTLAAAFMRRGYPILADDVVPVDSRGWALPGFPRIKLWRDVAEHLELDTNALKRIRPGLEKFNLPLEDGKREAVPVRWIYVLGSEFTDDVRVEPLHGLERFKPLQNNTYRLRFSKGMSLQGEHLPRYGQLASRIHLARVSRPKEGFNLDALVDRLLADMAEAG